MVNGEAADVVGRAVHIVVKGPGLVGVAHTDISAPGDVQDIAGGVEVDVPVMCLGPEDADVIPQGLAAGLAAGLEDGRRLGRGEASVLAFGVLDIDHPGVAAVSPNLETQLGRKQTEENKRLGRGRHGQSRLFCPRRRKNFRKDDDDLCPS